MFDRPIVRTEEDDCGADEEPDVTNTNGKECLQGSTRVRFFFPPVTDEHERAQTHDFPAEDELQHVLRKNHDEHARREQRQRRKEMGVTTITRDVLSRVDLHQERNECDEQQQHERQSVDVLSEAKFETT